MKEKVCVTCKKIYEGDKCPNCGNNQHSDTIKGRLHVFNPEQSEIAKNRKITSKGEFAINIQ